MFSLFSIWFVLYPTLDDGDVFKWPLPTPDDRFRPRGIPQCLEDIEQCNHGFTASFNVTADIEGDDVIDFAPRFGNMLDSNVYDRGWKMPRDFTPGGVGPDATDRRLQGTQFLPWVKIQCDVVRHSQNINCHCLFSDGSRGSRVGGGGPQLW